MKKLKFRTQYNTTPEVGESNNGITITEPDHTVNIMELLLKHTTDGNRQPVYLEEQEIPNLEKMDLVEIQEYNQSINDEISELKAEQARIAKLQRDRLKPKPPKDTPTPPESVV